MPTASPTPASRLPRPERREQILAAATRAFARGGYAAIGLDDVAAEAGISRVILYRHFDSKKDLYHSVLDRAGDRISAHIDTTDYGPATLPALLAAATADPDGFKLLFRYAAREPEFRDRADRFNAQAISIAHHQLTRYIEDPAWVRWAAQLAPMFTGEAIVAWLDAGMPDPDTAQARIAAVLDALIEAARGATPR
ncbi:MAG TPA: TetR/AcrR family transcriptional regulator [Stackebrandtia sp.]|jgi:AcrR family transcriptional regulator|uniref:TetR/AcrR family transcriptional regulator n=1 Tax=Stackebrandtia sp. TaxID=2023065 RepID=UPI002D4001E3|nr:TetR/AcrR family transcriptional regulator [Stackebrandtia sp.]HZE37222.1 TetR/AcrR family transcriptional regulator [Stackebrandtia sp.]